MPGLEIKTALRDRSGFPLDSLVRPLRPQPYPLAIAEPPEVSTNWLRSPILVA